MENIKDTIEYLRNNGFCKKELTQIHIGEAKEKVEYLMRYFLGDKYEWQPEYDKVVEWLTDNKGKGLLCSGNVGRGKSLLCANVIPILLNRCLKLNAIIVDATDLNDPTVFSKVKNNAITVIDDVGIEADYYGTPKFNELVKRAEDFGRCLIITTNLTSGEINKRYGERVLSRLLAICECVKFEGSDLRRKNFLFLQK